MMRTGSHLRIALLIAACALGAFAVLASLLWQYSVEGASMEPALSESDRLVFAKFTDIKRGDMVIFHSGLEGHDLLVKRVIGLEGDTIAVAADGSVVRNGMCLVEPYAQIADDGGSAITETVDAGCCYLLGDNRPVSIDSRDARIGMIRTDRILGRVMYVMKDGQISKLERVGE